MLKISYPKEGINVNKLHDKLGELGELGEQYLLTHGESEFHLMFPDLFERVSGEGGVYYEKWVVKTDGVTAFEPFDLSPILAQISETIESLDPLEDLKDQKLKEIQHSAEKAQKSFVFEGLTIEMAGQPEARLIMTQLELERNPEHVEMWFALNGTFKLGERDSILVGAPKDIPKVHDFNVFANAYKSRVGSVISWQKGAEYWLNQAQTIEEVEAISTTYND